MELLSSCTICVLNSFHSTVALAYAADVSPNRTVRDAEMSLMFAIYFIGKKFGGVFTILLEDYNLFTPLLAGAALNAIAFFPLAFLMVEPSEAIIEKDESEDESQDEEDFKPPATLDKRLVSGLCFISILDDIGGKCCRRDCSVVPSIFVSFSVLLLVMCRQRNLPVDHDSCK